MCIEKPYFLQSLFRFHEQNKTVKTPWKSSEHACHFAAGCWAAGGMTARAPDCIAPTSVCMFKAMEHKKHHTKNSQLSAHTVIYFPAAKRPFLKADAVSGETEATH